jgi:hypothetical protein
MKLQRTVTLSTAFAVRRAAEPGQGPDPAAGRSQLATATSS